MSDEGSTDKKAPRVFISYSWDSDRHKDWVSQLATRLRADCVDVCIDDWDLRPGDQLPHFMESAIRESDFVLLVCTPRYQGKANERVGGVGYEGNIITAELYTKRNERKFIPLWREGEWQEAAPSALLAKYHIDFRGEPYPEKSYEELLATLHDVRPVAPALRPIGGSSAHLAPAAVTRQKVYSDFVVSALGLVQACNQRFVLYSRSGPAASILRNEVEADIKRRAETFHALMQEINLLSSDTVKKAAGEILGWVFMGQVASMSPKAEKEFKEAHSKLASEALPKFKELIREEAGLR